MTRTLTAARAITAHALTMRHFVVQTCQSEAVGLLILDLRYVHIFDFFSPFSFRQKKNSKGKRRRQGFARSTESNREKSAESKKAERERVMFPEEGVAQRG